MKVNIKKVFNLISFFTILALGASVVSAQYYYPDYNQNYNNYNYNYNYGNYGYGNNPNNGVVNFLPNSSYNSNYYYDQNWNSNYYVQPLSISNVNYAYPNYYNNNNYNYGNYNNGYYYSTLSPVTYAATNVGPSYATVNGQITISGNNYNNNYGTTWFQYGTSQNTLNWSTNPAAVYGTTSVNANLTNLSCGTTYYFRLVTSGQNAGLQYGNTLSFYTGQCNYGYGQNYYNNYQNLTYWTPPKIITRCSTVKKYKKYY